MPTYPIIEQRSRFLYPFFMNYDGVSSAVQALLTLTYRERPVWQQPPEPHHLYTRETLKRVESYLFSGNSCRYLKINPEVANIWFQNGVRLTHKKRDDIEVRLESNAQIELFISPYGVVILSLTLEAVAPFDFDSLKEFNYRLSQARPYTAPTLSLPVHPTEPPPEPTAPLLERLGKRGGLFTLLELRDFLSAPLQPLGLAAIQEQFSVYTVVRFDKQADFTEATVCEHLKPLLTALAHVEEPTHVGSLELVNQVMNPRHWIGIGSLGIAHLVADQDPAHDFNNQRVPNVLKKYFIPYLCALLQRLTFQRFLDESAEIIRKYGTTISEGQREIQALHVHVLDFTVAGYFTEISQREIQNQTYRLIQNGLRIPETLTLVHRALNDIDATNNDIMAKKVATQLDNNVARVTNVQRKLEWLEVFFVSFYAAELSHLISDGFFNETYSHWSTVFWSIFAGGMAFWGLEPHRDHVQHQEKSWLRRYFPVMSLLLVAVIWFGVGYFGVHR